MQASQPGADGQDLWARTGPRTVQIHPVARPLACSGRESTRTYSGGGLRPGPHSGLLTLTALVMVIHWVAVSLYLNL